MGQGWEEVVNAKIIQLASKIPKEWMLKTPVDSSIKNVMDVPYTSGLMAKSELDLTEKDATELVGLLASGNVSSYEVTLAFCKRAAICQQLCNCMSDIFFDEGLERAKELDEIFAKTGKVVGPLHGLPFSIKDQFHVKGKDTAAGFVAWIGDVATEDAEAVRILRDSGAVFYCKTTVPQTLMHLESDSNIHGRTLNPFNRGLTSGGSSGGEGALVGFRGSPIGLGADGGGSIRVPAACVGAYGLRSTANRIPLHGLRLPNVGGDSTPVVVGPICRSARDNELFCKIMIEVQPWEREHSLIPLPWRTVPEPKKLKIGYYADDGVVNSHAPIQRAIKSLVEKLSYDDRFEFVPWTPYQHAKGYDLIRKLYFMDGGAMNFGPMEKAGEPVLDLSAWILKESHTKRRSIDEAWQLVNARDEYRREYLQYWNNNYVDVLLCPWGSGVAFRHNTARYWGYSAIWNLLDYPSMVFPTGEFVDPDVDVKDELYIPRDNEFDSYIQGTYEAKEFDGAPICVQLVMRPFKDEELFAALRVIEDALGRNLSK
jgi:amidase